MNGRDATESKKELGEYMTAKVVKRTDKTEFWMVESAHHDGVVLGFVKWNPAWRQYCFFPHEETVFSVGCLREIENLVEGLNKKHKNKPKTS